MNDFHIHPRSLVNAKEHITRIASSTEHDKNTVLVFANHFFMYPFADMRIHASYYNVTLVPAFSIKTQEGIEFHIHNPTKSARILLRKLSNMKCTWFSIIIEKLIDNGCLIHPGHLMRNSRKKFYELEKYDIAKEILNPLWKNENCENIEIAAKVHIKPIMERFPMMKPRLSELLDYINEEESFLICPNSIDVLKEHKQILCRCKFDGYISEKSTTDEIKEFFYINDPLFEEKQWLPGTNSWV